MKIGILTQPMHWNYGGILQNWALQQVLREMGHEPIKLERHYSDNSVREQLLKDIKSCLLYLIGRGKNRRLFSLFKSKRLNLEGLGLNFTKLITSSAGLRRISQDIDAFIVGSDQVWRQEYSPCITDFFLGFLDESDNRPKISYGASFGKRHDYIFDDKKQDCKTLLSRFSSISVRENEGKAILLNDFCINNFSLVLDPTLLLTSDDYECLLPKVNDSPKSYITAYFIDESNQKYKLLNEISRLTGVNNADTLGIRFECGPRVRIPSIGEWLQSIARADFVVTDSFHGMAFSLIFHRPFVVIANPDRGIDRYYTVLKDLALTERLIVGDTTDIKDIINSEIDWVEVDNSLNKWRKESMTFLQTSLDRTC